MQRRNISTPVMLLDAKLVKRDGRVVILQLNANMSKVECGSRNDFCPVVDLLKHNASFRKAALLGKYASKSNGGKNIVLIKFQGGVKHEECFVECLCFL